MQPNHVTVNGFNLNNIPFVEIDKRQPNDLPNRNVVMETTARGHGSKVVQAQYTSKKIRILGHILAPSRIQLDQAIDQLKYRTLGTEMTLDLVQAGTLRTYDVTLEDGGGGIDLNIIEAGKGTFVLNFVTSGAFGRDTLRTNLPFTNPMSAAINDTVFVFGGTWLAEPEIYVTVNSLTGGTDATMAIINPATGERISVRRTWLAGDVLYVDVTNKIITVNNTPVNYNGLFPRWESRDGVVRITDSFTARNITVTGNYFKRYI